MKKNLLFMIALLVSLAGSFTVKGQGTGCSNPDCFNSTLNISTGFNHGTSTYQTPLSLEPTWQLVAVPSNAPITLPAPAWVITPHPAWASFPSAQWISPFQNSNYWVNNPPPTYGPFEFRNCFCLCQQTTVNINFELLVDDGAYVYLDGTLIGTAMSGYQFQWANRLIVNTNLTLSAGTHCLRVELFNTGGVAMGFAMQGSITGANLLSSICCNPTGRICGTKLNDQNCDGVVDAATDPGLAGWTIILSDSLGNPIDTQVTDAYGNYCFDQLPVGTYTVSEVNQTGWTQTYPSTGIHTIGVTAGSANTANFGNCQPIVPPPCEFHLEFETHITDCQATFTAFVGALPPGYQVVSSVWTFGDGYSSTLLNPTHFYTTPGIYMVCLTVTIFNGTECCTRKICKEIRIEKACDGGCRIEAEIGINFDERDCIFEFTGNVLSTGAPITAWFWDFGDGTTGSGSTVNHQFPAPGVYTVCLYLFAQSDDECCFVKICRDIKVNCEPHGGGGTGGPKKVAPATGSKTDGLAPNAQTKTQSTILTDKNVIVLNQNVPNPFAESTVITYNIPSTYNKAQIVFTTSAGKTIKTVDITTKGEGRLNIFADDLTTGVYIYTLIVDGKTIESKSMVKH